MFTDKQGVPARVEILMDVLRSFPRGARRKDVYRLLQPAHLAGPSTDYPAARETIHAAFELGLVEESEGVLSLSSRCRRERDATAAILRAADELVLAGTDVEPYFALFYAYYLGLGKEAYKRPTKKRQAWADQFNKDVFESSPQPNPFNETKHKGIHHWLEYVGLGWFDPAENFQANPYDRLLRALPAIFGRRDDLDAEAFMKELAGSCPELDGGSLFVRANSHLSWQPSDKRCSLGLSHALVELHLDRKLRLICPKDSTGWSVEEADPPRGEGFKSTRFVAVEFAGRG